MGTESCLGGLREGGEEDTLTTARPLHRCVCSVPRLVVEDRVVPSTLPTFGVLGKDRDWFLMLLCDRREEEFWGE